MLLDDIDETSVSSGYPNLISPSVQRDGARRSLNLSSPDTMKLPIQDIDGELSWLNGVLQVLRPPMLQATLGTPYEPAARVRLGIHRSDPSAPSPAPGCKRVR